MDMLFLCNTLHYKRLTEDRLLESPLDFSSWEDDTPSKPKPSPKPSVVSAPVAPIVSRPVVTAPVPKATKLTSVADTEPKEERLPGNYLFEPGHYPSFATQKRYMTKYILGLIALERGKQDYKFGAEGPNSTLDAKTEAFLIGLFNSIGIRVFVFNNIKSFNEGAAFIASAKKLVSEIGKIYTYYNAEPPDDYAITNPEPKAPIPPKVPDQITLNISPEQDLNRKLALSYPGEASAFRAAYYKTGRLSPEEQEMKDYYQQELEVCINVKVQYKRDLKQYEAALEKYEDDLDQYKELKQVYADEVQEYKALEDAAADAKNNINAILPEFFAGWKRLREIADNMEPASERTIPS